MQTNYEATYRHVDTNKILILLFKEKPCNAELTIDKADYKAFAIAPMLYSLVSLFEVI